MKELARIVELPADERPRERLLEMGPQALATAELVAVLLGTGQATTGLSALGLARRLVRSIETSGVHPLAYLRDISPAELMRQPGIGPAKAANLLAAIELGRRLYCLPLPDRPVIDGPQAVAAVLGAQMAFARQEQFAVLLLDVKNRLIAHRIVSLGTIDETLAHPREVFREAVRQGAAGIIVAHNHPSGLTEPSPEDLRLTHQLLECGRTLQIPVLDHVILGHGRFTSLRRTTRLWQ